MIDRPQGPQLPHRRTELPGAWSGPRCSWSTASRPGKQELCGHPPDLTPPTVPLLRIRVSRKPGQPTGLPEGISPEEVLL
jgi:hypothetical protein